jgi:RNA polymerase sigma-70 factor (ECF subfamily)
MIAKIKKQAPGLSDPQKWVDLYGDQLYRYAFARVQNRMMAEDLVQEAFLAALSGRNAFEGRSSEKTWLTAILRNKIIDHFRGSKREQPIDPSQDHDKQLDHFFHENGSWMQKPQKWEVTPSELLDQKEFWTLFQRCLSELSERLRTAFNLREMEGLSCDEICKILGVSSSNCWVMLYRARMLLRRCLGVNWFGEKDVSLDV